MSSPEPEFGSVGEADAAYYGSSDGGGNNQNNNQNGENGNQNGSGASWGELQRVEFLPGDWALTYQNARGSDRQRFFVMRSDGETFEAIEADGVVVEEPVERSALERLPSYETEPAAREAHQAWVDSQEGGANGENGPGAGGQGGQGGRQYGEWTRIEQVGGWVIWGREAQNADARQFIAASVNTSGTPIYLQPEGEVAESAHVFEDTAALQDALEAFAERERQGNVPTDESPTGTSPDKSTVASAADEAGANEGNGGGAGGPLSGVVQAVGGPRNAAILAVGGGVGLYYANERGIVDVPGLDGSGSGVAPGGADV
jgi:hypothetical protein